MYLKRLYLQGFKSFPEKVKLEFTKCITAVVGPNGSGKSNVSDAVRWVLGEQRAKSLRGDKMEDIIFAGTETRKPQGFAEVTIVIDNEDGKLPIEFSEVQITRRVFRSGESEYRLNGSTCRLKDVQELLMDTGIGREGYSIIGQGRIDEILNAKGDERRRIFEEATGIVKYKSRKNEAEQKLEREQQNLLRVKDIISELETQLEPLSKESQKAKEYLNIREQLQTAELSLYCMEVSQIQEQSQKVTQLIADTQTQLQQTQQQNHTDQQTCLEQKKELEQKNKYVQQIQEEIVQVKTNLEKTEGQIRLSEQQQKNDADLKTRMEQEIQQHQKQLHQKREEQNINKSRIQSLQIALQQEETVLSRMEQEYDTYNRKLEESEQKAETVKDEIFENIRIGTEAKGEISKREAMLEQFTNRQEQLDIEIAHAQSQQEQYHVHLQVLQKKKQEQQQTISFLEKELTALEQDFKYATNQKQNMEQQVSTEQNKVSEQHSRLSLLQELERDHEGYFYSVKSLLNLPDREQRGICGAVGQLLTVPELYETAIESALGAALQNIVTKTEEQAKNAIDYLKTHKLGRATFLPISAIQSKSWDGKPAILSEKGVIGTAHTLVSFASEYTSIMTYLLGKILIVETLDDGVRLAKKYHHQYKMVTLDGDLIHAGGSMTGGSKSKKTSNLFGRSREIQQLQIELKKSYELLQNLQQQLSLTVSDLQDISSQNMEKKLELQKLTVTIHGLETEIQKNETDIAETEQKCQLLKLEQTQLQEQITRTKQDIETQKQLLANSQQSVEKANIVLTSFQEHVSKEKQARETLLQNMTQSKIRVTQHIEQMESTKQILSRLQVEEQALIQELQKKQIQIQIFAENEGKRTETQEQLQQRIQQLQQKEQNLHLVVSETRQQMDEIQTYITHLEEQIQNTTQTDTILQGELARMESRQEKLSEDRNRVCDTLWEEYELSYPEAKQKSKHETRSYTELQHLRKSWKEHLRDMGAVNVQAITQYEEIQQRYTFLTAQKQDILDAESQLRGLIVELTSLMQQQFTEQFAIISQNFQEVFQEIFGGGKAYLKLSDEQNALQSSIEIVAQPPGKSLQNMQLLSGGERALTAIAILFSILKLKPSPFCILDEIEAALDDANVRRYAQYLTKFSDDTQFIVITHRKGTMEYADILYGVTMQEKGVSKLISVDFTTQTNII